VAVKKVAAVGEPREFAGRHVYRPVDVELFRQWHRNTLGGEPEILARLAAVAA
jgi:hypothetical protein